MNEQHWFAEPSRTLRDRMTDELADTEMIDFPAQLGLTRALAKACSETARTHLAPLWAGQTVRWCATCLRPR